MYWRILTVFVFCLFSLSNLKAQDILERNKDFKGATATENHYKVVFQMDQGAPETIKKVFRNINNLLKDPRLSGKLEIELVAFSGGTEAYRKGSEYEQALINLIKQGVQVVQCSNTLIERKIDKSELYDFLAYVPTGNGELVIRAKQGWVIIKP